MGLRYLECASLAIYQSVCEPPPEAGAVYVGNFAMPFRVFRTDLIVNNRVVGLQDHPASALLSDGRYVVAFDTSENDSFRLDVRARIIDPNGPSLPAALDIAVNGKQPLSQNQAEVTGLSNGGFAVLYKSDLPSTATGPEFGNDLRIRFYDSKGFAKNSAVTVDNTPHGFCHDYQVHTLLDGRVIVVWNETAGATDLLDTVKARIFSKTGEPNQFEFVIKAGTESREPIFPQLVAQRDGGFLVTYQNGTTIDGKKFTATGLLKGSEFRVSGDLNSGQPSSLVELSNGKVLSVWRDDASGPGKLVGRLLNGDGTPAGTQFDVQPTPGPNESLVKALTDGRFIVAHFDRVETGPGVFANKVYMQFFENDGSVASSPIEVDNTFFASNAAINNLSVTDLKGGKIAVSFRTDQPDIHTLGGDGDSGGVASTIINTDFFDGTAANDRYIGGSRSETMTGLAGKDVFFGRGGNDSLNGGKGADKLNGGSGDDKIIAGDGDDILTGGTGNDVLEGGLGRDKIEGNGGSDSASYFSDPKGVRTALDGSLSPGQQTGHAKNDTYVSIENLAGSNRGADSLTGDKFANVLSGNSGNDKLFGLAGDDTLIGGRGADKLSGGAGTDTYQYDNLNEGNDSISNFGRTDVFAFKGTNFGKLSAGKLDAVRFHASNKGVAHDSNDRFVFDTTHNVLFFDSNGDANGGVTKIATFNFEYTMNAGDILIV
jgi:RTX calcium-binding nonapeptide repeat (4 copies)